MEAQAQQLERQWTLRRERARYEAERARRQYDAVEPENRLVARSLEQVWEEKLRALEAVEQDHTRWQRAEPLVLSDVDLLALRRLGEDLPRIWNAAATAPAERKRLLRFVVRAVVLDQKRVRGQVWIKIVWQTGATSEHRLQRRVHAYHDYIDSGRLRDRITALNGAGLTDEAIAARLNTEGLVSARGRAFAGGNVWLLRRRFGILTAKINGVSPNPARWPDGSYSIQGAAAALGVTAQTVFKWLRRGRLVGRQSSKGQPCQIVLTPNTVEELRARARRTRRSRMAAS